MPRRRPIDTEDAGSGLPAELVAFVNGLDPDTLRSTLLDLARNDDVAARLKRLKLAERPVKLAAVFRKSLTGWRRGTRFLDYRAAGPFASDLQAWLDQVERELLPRDPAATLALAREFVELDAGLFDRADDSNGSIGDAMRAGCRLWLKAAAACESPMADKAAALLALADSDEYGARETLLRYAGDALDVAAQRDLVAMLEARLDAAVAAAKGAERLPYGVLKLASSLTLLSQSLRDPSIQVRATLRYSPDPNPRQRESFVDAFLECGAPDEALTWLEGSWDTMEDTRLRLRAKALQMLDRTDEAAAQRRQVFEMTRSVFDLEQWLALIPPGAQPPAFEVARSAAESADDPVAGAQVLLVLGDAPAAGARLLAQAAQVDGQDYGRLVPLAQALAEAGDAVGATLLYRRLLDGILDRANARAYGHAARYWARLHTLAADLPRPAPSPLTDHETFVADIRRRHARKVAFWAAADRVLPEGS